VTEDVEVGDLVGISKGSTAVGHVVEVEPKRRLGRAGKLSFSIDFVKAPDGANIRLRASSARKGEDKTGTVIVGSVLLSPLFLIMRGKDVSIPRRTNVMAYVDGDREFALPSVFANDGPVSEAALTNDDVLKLKNAGLGDPIIIGKIKASPADYHLDTNDIIDLKRAGLSEAVIEAMLEAAPQLRPAPVGEAATTATGLVQVPFRSNPPGALVSFGGMPACYTPCVLKLEARRVRVTMTLAGYAGWTREIAVEAGKPVAAELQR